MTRHAVYSPSSAGRWTQCTASAEAIAMLPEQDESDAAREGTEAHEELERVLSPYHDRPDVKLDADKLMAALDQEHPSAYGIALMLKYAAGLPAGRFWIEQRVELTPAIWGRCDVAHYADGVLTVLDLKNGFVGVDAKDNEQLMLYAAASVYTHNLPLKYFRLVIVQPNDFRPGVPRVKQWPETANDWPHCTADSLFAFATRVAGIPAGRLEFKAGEHCRYCPLFGRCEPTRDLLSHLSVAMQHTPDEVRDDQIATYLTLRKPIEDYFKSLDKSATKRALAGTAVPGMKLVATTKHRAWRNEADAKAAILAKLGPDALDVPTPAQAEKLGMPEDWVASASEKPDGGPALAFASDNRPEFKRPSAAEMFKDVMVAK